MCPASSGVRLLRRGAAVFLAAWLLAPAVLAAPRVESVDAAGGSARFRVSFPPPEWRTTASGGATYRYPVWDGLDPTGKAGHPQLPAEVVRVALPPSPDPGADPAADVRLTVETAGGGTLSGVRFPPAPREVSAAGGGTTWSAEEGPAYRGPGRPVAELRHVDIERGLRIAVVVVHPVTWDPSTDGGRWLGEVTVTVHTGGVARPAAAPRRLDRASAASWNRTLVNPEAAAGFLAPAADSLPPPGGVPSEWFDDAAGWLKIDVDADGLYVLTRTALADAGVPVTTLDPRTLRLFAGPLVPEVAWAGLGWNPGWAHVYDRPGFAGGFDDPGSMNQVAIRVEGEADGVLGSGDRVVFYGLGPDNFRDRFGLGGGTTEAFLENPYTDHTVYWLAWGGTFTQAPLRMETVDATPQGGAPVDTAATERVHAERNSIYAPSLYEPGVRWETWFWDTLDNQSAGKRFFVPLPGLDPGVTLDAAVRFWGADVPTKFGSGDDFLHHVQVEVNGTAAGLVQWGGFAVDTALTRQDAAFTGLPAADPCEFIFRVPDVGTDPARFDQSYLAWIEVTYRRRLTVPAGGSELPVDGGTAGRTLRVTQPSGSSMDVYDVSDFRRPRRLTGGALTPGVALSTLDLAWDRASGGRLLVAPGSAVVSPARMALDDPPHPRPQDTVAQWLRDTSQPLDYVIIAFDDFASEAEMLADWRRSHLAPFTPDRGGHVRVVRVSDVMDEFTYGMWDPAAIRYFLEYAYRYYGAPGDDRLSYCLLLGDHTYDYRDVLGTGERDYVPSWEDNRVPQVDGGNVQYCSDDPLARFDGDDAVPDLYLGRITASTVAEARGVIQKIRGAEESPVYGPWRARVFLATDDLCQGSDLDPRGYEFLTTAGELDALLPRALDRRKLFLTDYGTNCIYPSKPEATADFIADWNAGAAIVHYLGHGNEAFLANERLIDLQDIPQLNDNAGRLPIFVATASRTGKFNVPGQDGITESLLLLAPGGALATSGSGSNDTDSDASYALGKSYMAGLFPGGNAAGPAAAGAAFMEAKRQDPITDAIYTFFGDPATAPPVPGLSMTVTGPDTLGRGQTARVSARVEGAAGRSGTAEIRAEDTRQTVTVAGIDTERPGRALFVGTMGVVADSASGGFVVPAGATPGPDARVRVYAWGNGWDALGALDPEPLGGSADPSADTVGPLVAFETHPPTVAVGDPLTVTLEDPSGIRLARSGNQGLDLVVEDTGQTEVARIPLEDRFAYDEGSYTRGTVGFPVPDLETGSYTFRILAYDNYDNLSTTSETVEVRPASGTARFTDVYAYPNPLTTDTRIVFTLDRGAEVTVRIYAVSGRLVRSGKTAATAGRNGYPWDGRDQAGDRVANGVYLVQLAAAGGARHLERVVVLR